MPKSPKLKLLFKHSLFQKERPPSVHSFLMHSLDKNSTQKAAHQEVYFLSSIFSLNNLLTVAFRYWQKSILPLTLLWIGILVCFSPFLSTSVYAQSNDCMITIEGVVIDEHDEEGLGFATIFLEEEKRGIVTDEKGAFTLHSVCEGEIHLVIQHINCEALRYHVHVHHDTSLVFHLEHHTELLSTVTVESEKETSSQTKTTLKGKTLEQSRGKSLGEIMENIAGVSTLKTGPHIAKPIIHGLYGNRILLFNNGLEQEGQQWGREHAPEIDPFTVDQITVVKGAAAVKYGTRALSGVAVLTPKPLPTDRHLHGSAHLVGMSNGRQAHLSATLEGSLFKSEVLTWRARGTFKNAGDAHAANYSLTNTGERLWNYALTMGYVHKKISSELHFNHYNNTTAILSAAHIGSLTDLQTALTQGIPRSTEDFSYQIDNPKQLVQHYLLKAKWNYYLGDIGTIKTTYGFQFNHRREFDSRRADRSKRPVVDLTLLTHSFDAAFDYQWRKEWTGEVGIHYKFQDNSNIPGTGAKPLIPNYRFHQPAIYWLTHWHRSKWGLELGSRYDFQHLHVKKFDEKNQLIQPKHQFQSWANSFGLVVKPIEHLAYRLQVGSAFRPPHVSELYSEGLHQGTASIEKGDPNLGVEKALKLTNTLTYSAHAFSAEWSTYWHRINNYIYLQPQKEPSLTIRGAFPVFQYTQTDAHIFGMDASARLVFLKNAYWESRASWTRGRNVTEKRNLLWMPAPRWQNKLGYSIPKVGRWEAWEFSVKGQQIWRQRHAPLEEELAPPPDGYFLVSVSTNAHLPLTTQSLSVYFTINNLFNVSYRDYLNRLRYFADDLGRNIEIRLKYNF